jgi:hypothetical protein
MEKEYIAIVKDLARYVEENCDGVLTYHFSFCAATASLYVYEVYASDEAFFSKSAQSGFTERIGAFAAPLQIKGLEFFGNPSPKVIDAMAWCAPTPQRQVHGFVYAQK